jgi:hypothetical protein
MCELRMFNFLFVVSPSLISRHEISFLAFHGCTAGKSTRGYAEKLVCRVKARKRRGRHAPLGR